jgi:TATA-box binding protein (TBP) (component of TFIID and TFIIIB)
MSKVKSVEKTTKNRPSEIKNIKPFKDLDISTTTCMCYINVHFNLEYIYKYIPVENITETNIKKINGTFGKIYQITPPDPKLGPTKGIPNKKRLFRNQSSIKIFTSKFVTIKMFAPGKLHLTGCKTLQQQKQAVAELFRHFRIINREHPNELAFIMKPGFDKIIATFDVVMVNVDFHLDFNIDQKKLDKLIQNDSSEFYTYYESPVTTSVNIKLDYPDPKKKTYDQIIISGEPEKQIVQDATTDKCPEAAIVETRTHTFLVFNSSKVIQSGRYYGSEMEPAYCKFNEYIQKNKANIELELSNKVFDMTKLNGIVKSSIGPFLKVKDRKISLATK